MATSYKSPGVYVEEIPKFPPSIAAVETAIPAFIGYTYKAVRNGESLYSKPTRIESIAEYELLFGGAPLQDVTLSLDANNQLVKAEAVSKLYLYDSLRMFYANGGGNCYILSVGAYPNSVSSTDLENALALLEQEDEPTIIIAPDAISDAGGPYEFLKKALMQCNKLMDRVTVCDLKKSTENTEFGNNVAEFRERMGINYLKYGAAYGPWIKTNLPRTLLHRNVLLKRDPGNTDIQLNSLTSDKDLQSLIADLINVEGFVNTGVATKNILSGGADKTLEDKLKGFFDTYTATTDVSARNDIQTALQSISNYMVAIVKQIQTRYTAAPVPATNRFKLVNDIDKYILNSKMKAALKSLADHHNFLGTLPAADIIGLLTSGADLDLVAGFLQFTDGATLLALPVPAEVSALFPVSVNTPKKRGNLAIMPLLAAVNEAITFYHFLERTQTTYEKTLNEALIASFGTYKELVGKAAEALNILPPSGAIAGVYAATDRDRGVWKAPANVSLNNVIGPSVKITQEQQAEYNIDVNSGKSINIIRSFTGKGTLVWGARTLAGNDNEWRYINVRRFFNFVEESVKKATEQFVFEPNDANTWVKVQAMIENFLTTLWRQGALQGIKPEHAFYVAVGLGKTMTPLDILEGRMIIEIGMAAVRPAEFIILRFSHKMVES